MKEEIASGIVINFESEKQTNLKSIFAQLRDYELQVKWSNVMVMSTLHILVVIGLVYFTMNSFKLYTAGFAYFIGTLSGLGMSVGAHRLWAHKTFKARTPLRILLALYQTMMMNGSVFHYARDHRTHHKYTDTDADPENSNRGLFYSHVGWWFFTKSQTVKDHGNKLDFTDLKEDWVVLYQDKFYIPLFVLFGVIIPTIVPYYGWNEDIFAAFFVCTIFRTFVVLHQLFTINSLAHSFGHHPFNFQTSPTDNRLVNYLSLGEGMHNYHHTFPYDYRSSDKAFWESFNPTSLFIEISKLIGQAYDFKQASQTMIEDTVNRVGVAAYFGQKRGLCCRIVLGLFDWTLGALFLSWPFAGGLAYQLISGHTVYTW